MLLLTELQVREDAWTLFGFGSAAERDSFRALTTSRASAAGSRWRSCRLLSPDELARAVAQDDKAMIGRANGVGPSSPRASPMSFRASSASPAWRGSAAPRAGAAADALSALANLGFKPAEASAAVNAAQDELGPRRGARRARPARAQKSREMIVSVYSVKGGVGKTTLAVNLAWASSALSKRRTLLWDFDAQGAASYILGQELGAKSANSSITRDGDVSGLIRPSNIEGVAILPADKSLRTLDYAFHDLGKRKRLAKIAAELSRDYDRIIINCPPGLTDTSDQILRASDLVIVPVIPSALSQRSLDVIKEYVGRKKGPKVTLAPVFSMVDRRRALHQSEFAKHNGWPAIPMASAYEKMSEERKPIG